MLPLVFINLDDANERRIRMEAQLSAYPLQNKRLSAVRWSDLSSLEQNRLYSQKRNKKQYYQPLTDGEKGCYASHILAWKQLLSSEAPALVVLEDDVILTEQFIPTIKSIFRSAETWDMIKLIGRPRKEKIHKEKPLSATHKLIQYRRIPSYTAGYIVHREGAKKLLRSRVPFGRPVDVDLRFWWENDMHIFGVWPSIVQLDTTGSTTTISGRHQMATHATRWRKIAMKAQLLWGNNRHLRSQ